MSQALYKTCKVFDAIYWPLTALLWAPIGLVLFLILLPLLYSERYQRAFEKRTYEG